MKDVLINQKLQTLPETISPVCKTVVSDGDWLYHHGDKTERVSFSHNTKGVWIFYKGHNYFVEKPKAAAKRTGHNSHGVVSGTITSPMPGKIFKLLVKKGDAVKVGQELLVLEAMKMEHSLVSPCDGTIAVCNVSEGAVVELGQELVVVS